MRVHEEARRWSVIKHVGLCHRSNVHVVTPLPCRYTAAAAASHICGVVSCPSIGTVVSHNCTAEGVTCARQRPLDIVAA